MTNTSGRPLAQEQDAGLAALLFTFRGRANRARYWAVVLVVIAINLIVAAIMYSIPDLFGGALLALPIILWGVVAVVGILTSIRRLHDRDKSGHWLWLFAFLPVVLNVIGNAAMIGDASLAPVGVVFGLIALGISIWAFIELGCLRGTQGPNRFGPDPLQHAAA
jgi:uncharacterized membrane protein YhaH (DUF805 family)